MPVQQLSNLPAPRTQLIGREGDLAALAARSDGDYPEEARQGVRVPGLDRLLLELNPVSPGDLLSPDVEVWAEEPTEGLPAEGDHGITEDVVPALYDEDLPDPHFRFVTTASGEGVETVSAPPVTVR